MLPRTLRSEGSLHAQPNQAPRNEILIKSDILYLPQRNKRVVSKYLDAPTQTQRFKNLSGNQIYGFVKGLSLFGVQHVVLEWRCKKGINVDIRPYRARGDIQHTGTASSG